ncbi:MAG TPA: phosphoglycerate dehydrogenase [Candidatus Baltobacteraceae bacterium]|nr:phosphoglycerate dehydrogenase [Candidatus Baltobacteraceae bacterium]
MVSPSSLGRVVVAEPFDERGLAVLREAGAEVISLVGRPREALFEALHEARGLIVRSETRVDAALLDSAPRLEVVARAGVGVDAIDVEAATAAGIVVVNTPSANTLAATEHTFALLLAAMRHVPQAHAGVHAGRWERKPFVGHELHGKMLGIIGLGRIGSNVASRAAAFGMRVVAHDPYLTASRARALNVELCALDDLLERSQVITLHVPLTAQTRGMIDRRALSRMRDDAVLVNCARGGVIDADALLEALERGRLRAVAIDVVPQEPPPPDSASARLLTHDRVVATPHLGGSTYEALERIALELAVDVVRVLGGRPASGAVNAPILHGADAERASAFVDLAHRLGAAVPQLFDDPLRHEIALVLQGELESVEAEPFAGALLAGALPLITDRRVTLVNAAAIAREIGVSTVISREPDASPFRAALVVAAGDHRIVGTVLPHGPRIVEIDGFEIDAVADGTMLVTHHRDVPGMVGRIGTILGEENVNISTMQVARTTRGGGAMMVLEVDREIDRAVLERIAQVEGMASVRLVRL